MQTSVVKSIPDESKVLLSNVPDNSPFLWDGRLMIKLAMSSLTQVSVGRAAILAYDATTSECILSMTSHEMVLPLDSEVTITWGP